jgi:type II secretory pathway component PulC
MSSKKYFVPNILLSFAILVIAIENYETWNHPAELLPDKRIAPEKSEIKNENPPMTASTKEPTSVQSYYLISEKNIFSPERTDFPTPAATAEAEKPIARPQVILYGVAIGENYQSAAVVNPGRTLRKGEGETLNLKVGEKIGEYTLTKILPDRITMKGDGDTFEVLLYDYKNPKRYVEPRPKSEPSMIASLQTASAPNSGEAPNPAPSQESVEKPTAQVQAQAVTPLQFNQHTNLFERMPPSATIRGRRIFYRPPGSSPQESVEK